MCPRRNKPDNSKRQERETRQHEKKSREKQTYLKDDEDAKAFSDQLRTFNLQLRDIVGDGNCLFRSCELLIKLLFFLFKTIFLFNSW
jgi:hypothetical protein